MITRDVKNHGHLFLVVGPSGAGKDSLLRAAARHFQSRDDIYMPRRVITRPADAGDEDHVPASVAEFEELEADGAFALSWGAHNLRYGVPRHINDQLAEGKHVIVNVSRAILDQALQDYDPVTILSIEVSATELERRLHLRGRETAADIAARIARAEAYRPQGPKVVPVDNSGALPDAEQRFIQAIEMRAGRTPALTP